MPESRLRDVDRSVKDQLELLLAHGLLVITPPGDYDDAYLVDYTRKQGGVVVSNDQFRDYIRQEATRGILKETSFKVWLESCRCSYTFAGNEFLPNPAFDFDRAIEESVRQTSNG